MSTTPETGTYEVSFIYNDRRIQAEGELSKEQLKALKDVMASDERPMALSLMPIDERSRNHDGSAVELVEVIMNAVGIDIDDEDSAQWRNVLALGEAVDQAAETCSGPRSFLVEFVWSNGGGDDNLFGQAFLADTAGPENEARIDTFLDALEAVGEDYFYDFGASPESDHGNNMSIDDLLQWISDEGDEDEILTGLERALQEPRVPTRNARPGPR